MYPKPHEIGAEDKTNRGGANGYAALGPGKELLLPSYAKASLPSAAYKGMIYVTDEVGGAVPAFSDGTNWRRVTDRAIVS